MKYDLKLEPAFVIHRRVYRDTSLLIDFFTPNYGLVTAVARGARSAKSSMRGILHSFIPLVITCRGQNLLTLFQAETQGKSAYLRHNRLMAGLYINELLAKLLTRHDPHPQIFNAYQQAILQLVNGDSLEITLRCFEKQLLEGLGYGLQFDKLHDGQSIRPEEFYTYYFEVGFCRIDKDMASSSSALLLPGYHLQAIQRAIFDCPEVQQSAKQLFRQIIQYLLANHTINTRALLIAR